MPVGRIGLPVAVQGRRDVRRRTGRPPVEGAYVVIAVGDSMSAARQDFYAHPPQAPDCLPRTRHRLRFRQVLDGSRDHG